MSQQGQLLFDVTKTLPLHQQFEALAAGWRSCLTGFLESPVYPRLCTFVDGEREAGKIVYPPDAFRALNLMSAD